MLNRQLTEDEFKKLNELFSKCSDIDVFGYQDLIIKGMPVDVIKEYISENPSKKFRIWLIDRGYSVEIKEKL